MQGSLVESGVSADHTHLAAGNGKTFSIHIILLGSLVTWSDLTKDEVCFFDIVGAFSFELEYTRWKEEHQKLINDLRSGVNSQLGDNDLRVLVDAVMSHYDEIFRLKGIGTKVDVFHMLSGMWKTPAERFFMWLGGFRSSELLKVKDRVQNIFSQSLVLIFFS